jgi:hypothetical protein
LPRFLLQKKARKGGDKRCKNNVVLRTAVVKFSLPTFFYAVLQDTRHLEEQGN